jgi:D-3-phosphoglycerate dehydrogenase
MGRIGKEVVKRARAFDMNVRGYDLYWDEGFAKACSVDRCTTAEDAVLDADFVSLHMNLDDQNRGFINKTRIAAMKKGAVIINTARGGLVVEEDVAEACKSGQLGGYAADVLDHEPQKPNHPFVNIDNIIITPHVGSRTFESVERQAMRATMNIVNYLNGEQDYIQANKF